MAKEVKAWQGSDGNLFLSQELAERSEVIWEFRQWCWNHICVGGEWSAEAVVEAILKEWTVARIPSRSKVDETIYQVDETIAANWPGRARVNQAICDHQWAIHSLDRGYACTKCGKLADATTVVQEKP